MLDAAEGKSAVNDLLKQWKEVSKLTKHYQQYRKSHSTLKDVSKKNAAQIALRETFDPFFEKLHQDLKVLDKAVRSVEKSHAATTNGNRARNSDRQLKGVKAKLSELHAEMKSAEESFKHIAWLQERFPKAEYEDVTGLCKLVTLDEVKDQDYSLNPGRYVGVVIEEDGRTDEEFAEELARLNEDFRLLTESAAQLSKGIIRTLDDLIGPSAL